MSVTSEYVAASERLLLRPMRPSDIPCVAGWLADPDLSRAYLVSEETFGDADLAGVMEWSEEEPRVQAWAMDDREGRLVAAGNSKPDFPFDTVWECEVFLAPDLPKGRGYGLEAHHVVVDHVLASHREARKVMGRSASFNTAAIRIMEKLGCRFEGRLRDQIELAGETYDLVVYGMLREEWEATDPISREAPR